MADSSDQPLGDGKKDDKIEAAAADGAAHKDLSNLPMVLAPKLGAGEDDAFDEAPAEPIKETAQAAESPASTRFMMLAATVAFAAAFGSFVGSVSGSGLAHFVYAPPVAPVPTAAADNSTSDALRAVKQQLAELSVIKSNLDAASRSSTSQFAKLADRLDRIDQHTVAAGETTGSIASPAPAVAQSASVEAAKLADRVLPNWVVQDVHSGRALVENNRGGVFEVGAGSVLPGLGRVGNVKRQDGQWVVVTENGTITSTGR
jgi:hypothetical protein